MPATAAIRGSVRRLPAEYRPQHRAVHGIVVRVLPAGGVEFDREARVVAPRRGQAPAEPVVPAALAEPETEFRRAGEAAAEQREPVTELALEGPVSRMPFLSDLVMTATWCEIAATSLVLCSGSLSRYRFGVVVLLGLFLRRSYPSAVTVPVTDSALKLRSTTPNRWVGFPARAFW